MNRPSTFKTAFQDLVYPVKDMFFGPAPTLAEDNANLNKSLEAIQHPGLNFFELLAQKAINFHDYLKSSNELGPSVEKMAKFVQPLDQMGQSIKHDPLRALIPNPVANVKAAAGAFGVAMKDPNPKNIANAVGYGLAGVPMGGVSYRVNSRTGLPQLVEPESGALVGPTSRKYFGSTGQQQTDALLYISKFLKSHEVDENLFFGELPSYGHTALTTGDLVGKLRGNVVPPNIHPANPVFSANYSKNMGENISKALEVIPTGGKRVSVTSFPMREGIGGQFSPGRHDIFGYEGHDQVYLDSTDPMTIGGALSHEMTHAWDHALNTPLFSRNTQDLAKMPTFEHFLGPHAAFDNYILETRAEAGAAKFGRYLENHGLYDPWHLAMPWPKK